MALHAETIKDSDEYNHDWRDDSNAKVKFVIFGEEMLEKLVKPSGKGGRIYLPPGWVGRSVKIIRTD